MRKSLLSFGHDVHAELARFSQTKNNTRMNSQPIELTFVQALCFVCRKLAELFTDHTPSKRFALEQRTLSQTTNMKGNQQNENA